ncbi:hypothetical protein G6F22_017746 [Rhizopus arrhizus]|nr:hypothetical protein G6F22_017746 [Rhizopus arrhizus]
MACARRTPPPARPCGSRPLAVSTACRPSTHRAWWHARTTRPSSPPTNQSAIDSTCNYTAKMNGTSASAPMVSGVAALVLEANPRLSYRDVKYILATTATRNHPNQPAVTLADGRTLVPGWTVNAANRAYSNCRWDRWSTAAGAPPRAP